MIRIDRTGTPCPDKLRTDGENDLLRLRGFHPKVFKSADFDGKIYGTDEVKACLWTMQHGKCCYCEHPYERRYSDVEHFRPKAEAVRDRHRKEGGYWWLAYRFDNLYFSCNACNRSNKKSKFPLRADARALVAEEDPQKVKENALLIDPGFDNPEEDLTFVWIEDEHPGKRGYQIAPLNLSERGDKTIRVLGLDRDDLTRNRQNYYRLHLQPLLKRFAQAQANGDPEAEEIRQEARALTAPNAPYVLLARVALRTILEVA